MTLKPEDIIREAELDIERNTTNALEKKAVEVANDLIAQRKENMVVDPAIKSFQKLAAIDLNALKATGTTLFKNIMANKGARNMAIGAGGGALAGAIGNKDDRMGGALKGGLLGGLGGAAVSALPRTLPTLSMKSPIALPMKDITPAATTVEGVLNKVKPTRAPRVSRMKTKTGNPGIVAPPEFGEGMIPKQTPMPVRGGLNMLGDLLRK